MIKMTRTKVPKNSAYATFASSIGWNKHVHFFSIKQLNGICGRCGIGIMSSEILDKCTSDDDFYFLDVDIQNKECKVYCLDANGPIYDT